MKILSAQQFVLAFIISIWSTLVLSGSLCSSNELSVWSCNTKDGRIASICGSKDLSRKSGYMQYRIARNGSLEMVYPESRLHPKGIFQFNLYANTLDIKFSKGAYTYTMYSDPKSQESAIFVEKNEKIISTIDCSNYSDVDDTFMNDIGISNLSE